MDTGSGSTVALRLLISGRVQGVAFRVSLREQAIARGLSGWTRNRFDGTVEAVVCGARADVDALARWACSGPTGARVDRVEREACAEPSCAGFAIRPTA